MVERLKLRQRRMKPKLNVAFALWKRLARSGRDERRFLPGVGGHKFIFIVTLSKQALNAKKYRQGIASRLA
jgi:hypothetical protein